MNNSRNPILDIQSRGQLSHTGRTVVPPRTINRPLVAPHRAYFDNPVAKPRSTVAPKLDLPKKLLENVSRLTASDHGSNSSKPGIIHKHLPVKKHPTNTQEQNQDDYLEELIDDVLPLEKYAQHAHNQKPKKKLLHLSIALLTLLLISILIIGYSIYNSSQSSGKNTPEQKIEIGSEKYSITLPDQVSFVDQKSLDLSAGDPGFYSLVTPKKVVAKSFQSADKKLSIILTNTLAGTDLINNVVKLNPANKDLSIEQYLAKNFDLRKSSFQLQPNNDEASKTELKKLNITEAKILSLDSYITEGIMTEVVTFEGTTPSYNNPSSKLDIKGKLATYYYKKDSLNVMVIAEKNTWDKKLPAIETFLKTLRIIQ
jgi:hypothetical protein